MPDTPDGWVEARDLEKELIREQPQLAGQEAEYRRLIMGVAGDACEPTVESRLELASVLAALCDVKPELAERVRRLLEKAEL